jgi:carboxypeptidase PM20D1
MNASRAAESLSRSIRFKTVSNLDYSRTDPGQFRAFEDWLLQRYPLAAARLEPERVGEWGMLFTWKGKDPRRAPFLLMAHYDVVDADASHGWTKDPWGGEIAEGYVWGRGAFDDKLTLISVMEAAETLLEEGCQPEQGFCLAFGADEEVGGSRGAAAIGALLKKRGQRFEFCVDEGGVVLERALPFLKAPAALIGVAEKGHVNYELCVRAKSGHASAPGRDQAAIRLSRAIVALSRHPFPLRMTHSLAAFLRSAARHAPFPLSLVLGAPRLYSRLIALALGSDPQAAAMFRSTMAFTMLEGSAKENVLPDAVKANINARLLPGDSIESGLSRIGRIAGKHGADARVKDWNQANEPLPESPTGSAAWNRIAAILGKTAPGCVALPYLVTASTDTRHYLPVAESIYRIQPALVDSGEIRRMHSFDERASIENIERCVAFFRELMKGEIHG